MNSLKNISFSCLNNWDVKSHFRDYNIFKKNIDLVLFESFLSKTEAKKIQIKDNEEYSILGVRSYGKGAYINRKVLGKTLKMRVYQQAQPNQLFWCKVDTKKGAFGIIDETLSHGVASSNMIFSEINTEKINLQYLQILFKSKKINDYMDSFVTGTTNRKYIKPDQLRQEIKIPLPSLTIQNRIVKEYNDKILKADKFEAQAKALEASIEEYLFEQLGIEITEQSKKTTGLNIISFKHLDIWGADKLLRGGINNVLESKIFPNQKLGQVLKINPSTDLSLLQDESEMSFIPMKNVSDEYGTVLTKDDGVKEKSKGYTKFKNGDLIWARITPCMQNGKSAIVNDLKNGVGYGSTEYHVLREINEDFDIEFAYHLLRTNAVRTDAINYFTGSAGQQRVPKSYLENLLVPMPPIKIQQTMAEHISELKLQIKTLKKQAIKNRHTAITDFEKEIFSQ